MVTDYDPSKFQATYNKSETFLPDLKAECIIGHKVFAHYQQNRLEETIIELPDEGTFEFSNIKFSNGNIKPASLIISNLSNRPNFKRVQLSITISYKLEVKQKENGEAILINGKLPILHKDMVMFIPEANDEFTYDIAVDTTSRLMAEPIIEDTQLKFLSAILIIFKVVGRIQLLIPVFDFCPEPLECEEFIPS
ncbi:hypothetical protein [Alkaliphilus serpentinus]|uniref:DUF3794 domain-containing protein n=1 Tax=Alkaliphilus serpentinus TaxID=1482731 RepID=A0A833HMJ4_9FIRM|nr:hypothetical protein [Alkaliphilus serpentinus]KAB3527635.1 hypothetical protein F8153_11675 [Alkaliphilus serpentinus]